MGPEIGRFNIIPGDDDKTADKLEVANKKLVAKGAEQAIAQTEKDIERMSRDPKERDRVLAEMRKMGIKFNPDIPDAKKPLPDNRIEA